MDVKLCTLVSRPLKRIILGYPDIKLNTGQQVVDERYMHANIKT